MARGETDYFLERAVPRKHTRKSVEALLGKPKFEYDLNSINACINSPAWELFDRGGKRWRPKIFSLILGAFGKKDPCNLGAVVEIVHNGTLVIDDIEDSSKMRRGKPTLHRIYGTDVSINLGNALYYLPLKGIIDGKIPEKSKLALLESYSIGMIRISHGQGLDIWWHRNSIYPTERQYLQMCAYKTGTLARMASDFAGIVAGIPGKRREEINSFAESLGVAFQIKDDLLDLAGDFKKFGKKIGGDITEGKKTLAVIYALKALGKGEGAELKRILSIHTRDPRKIGRAISLIKKSGAIERCKERALTLVRDSWKVAERHLPDCMEKGELDKLANFLVEREF